jgi:hypothetical protein
MADGAIRRIGQAALSIGGIADALSVWISTQKPPETFYGDIATVAKIARSHGLQLWLDVAAWGGVEEPRRSAYFLRLLALCQAARARVSWWNHPYEEGALLDGYWDPTWLYHAALAWQAIVDGPTEPVHVEIGDTVQIRWQDPQRREYVVWWRAAEGVDVSLDGDGIGLPSGALIADPLYGRLLDLSSVDRVPTCGWPLIARGRAR